MPCFFQRYSQGAGQIAPCPPPPPCHPLPKVDVTSPSLSLSLSLLLSPFLLPSSLSPLRKSYLQQHAYLHTEEDDDLIARPADNTENVDDELLSQKPIPRQTCDLNSALACSTAPVDTEASSTFVDCRHDNSDNKPPLVFSHLEPTTTQTPSNAGPTNYGAHVAATFSSCVEQAHQCPVSHCTVHGLTHTDSDNSSIPPEQDTVLLSQMQNLTVSSQYCSTRSQDLLDYHSNSVGHHCDALRREGSSLATANGSHGQLAWPRSSHGNGSCRDEALGVGYMDDVTVDDLAGYFDQMLYLPKPMSDMAQLMYT